MKHSLPTKAPDYCYTARKPCGCYVGACYAFDDDDTEETVREWKAKGYKVEMHGRNTPRYKSIIENLGCVHNDQPRQPVTVSTPPVQLSIFG